MLFQPSDPFLKNWCVVCCLESSSPQLGKCSPQVTATDGAVVPRLQRPPGLQETETHLRRYVSVGCPYGGRLRGRETPQVGVYASELQCGHFSCDLVRCLKGNCCLALDRALGPGGTSEQLERPVLMGLHPGRLEVRQTALTSLSKGLYLGLLVVVCYQKEKRFCFGKL